MNLNSEHMVIYTDTDDNIIAEIKWDGDVTFSSPITKLKLLNLIKLYHIAMDGYSSAYKLTKEQLAEMENDNAKED